LRNVKNIWILARAQFRAQWLKLEEKKVRALNPNPLILMVPEVGIEPTRTQGPGDFESKNIVFLAIP
jgi:hypothetical protein